MSEPMNVDAHTKGDAEALSWPEGHGELLELAVLVSTGRGRAPDSAPPDLLHRERARILEVPAEQALCQLDHILTGSLPGDGLDFLARSGALEVLLPEVSALVGFHLSCPVHHKDLWAHTLEVLQRTPDDPDLRWVALLHDAGKVSTRAVDGARGVSFIRHEQVGAHLMRGVGARLNMEAQRVERIAFVIGHHGRINAYETSWSDRAVRRLIRDSGARLDDLLAFSGVDFTTRRPERRRRIQGRLQDLQSRIRALRSEDQKAELPTGLGRVLMEALDIGPGPELGDVMDCLQAEMTAGRLSSNTPLEIFVEVAKGHRSQQE